MAQKRQIDAVWGCQYSPAGEDSTPIAELGSRAALTGSELEMKKRIDFDVLRLSGLVATHTRYDMKAVSCLEKDASRRRVAIR